jgi:hypothetical protein
VIYLYAVAEKLSGLPELEGVDGAPLASRRRDGFDLVVSEHATAAEPTEEAILTHARVVEALMPLAEAVLPARFGLAFADFSDLERAVCERAEKLGESLEQIRGRVELGVRVVGEQADPRPAESGRAYLECRRAQQAAVESLHESLAERAEAAARGRSGGRLVLSGAYLVEPEAVPAFRAAVDSLESEHPQFTFALTGPWPPYSFAGVDE